MDDDKHDNIFDKDDVLDFIIYKEIEKESQDQKGRKSGCLGFVVLLLLPVASMMLLCWKC